MAETVDTGKVTGRRKLCFSRLDEALADAEALAAGEWQQLGNWSLGKICTHLAKGLDSATDDRQATPPFVFKLLGPWIKGFVLKKGLKPGFQMTANMKPLFMPPDAVETADGLAAYRHAIERFRAAKLPARSTLLGKMTPEDWEQFHCRHAELHLSFIAPMGSE